MRARVTKVKRSHAEALATEVLRPGPERVEAPCAHFPACGGCRFQDLAYEAQLAQKEMQVRDALQRLAGIAEPPLEPILPCEPEIFHYRNKLEYSFTATPEGPALGFHRAGRWDEVLEIRALLADRRARERDTRSRLASGRERRASRRTRRPTEAAISVISSSGRAATRARRSSSS